MSLPDEMSIVGLVLTAIATLIAILAFIHQIQERRERRTKQTTHIIEQATQEQGLRLLEEGSRSQAQGASELELLELAARYIFISPDLNITVNERSMSVAGVFLDLLTACVNHSDREKLAHALSGLVRETERVARTRFDCVAVPKEGNILLGDAVARALSLPLIVVRTTYPIRFNYPFEGNIFGGWQVVLVDDVSFDGEFLKQCVKLLRTYGAKVTHCCCLFERRERQAREALESVGINLYTRVSYEINEEALKMLGKEMG